MNLTETLAHLGKEVTVRPDGLNPEMRKYLNTTATVLKITKAGLVYVRAFDGKCFSLPMYDLTQSVNCPTLHP